MLAEIVRNSFTDRGDLSELCSHICRVVIFSFERTKTNHDKLPRGNNNNASNYIAYIAHNLHKLKLCFLKITSENLGLLTQFVKR